jgi:hypothetical protein
MRVANRSDEGAGHTDRDDASAYDDEQWKDVRAIEPHGRPLESDVRSI